MSKPKNMTPEQEAAWKEKVAAQNKAYREENREKLAARQKAYNEANREKEAARTKAYYEANREKEAARTKAYRDSLSEGYVASTLRLKTKECPPVLLALKREQLMLRRLTKQLKQELKND